MATTRREFVKAVALGGIGALSAGLFGAAAYAEDESGAVSSIGGDGVISKSDDTSEKYQAIFDVLVVGSGMGGMSAAYEAASAGMHVAIIDMAPNYYEANSSVCAGMVWGWNTDVQKANGVPEQSYETCMAYLDACGAGLENKDVDEVFVNEADDNVKWLISLGVELPDDLLLSFGAEDIVKDVVDPVPHTLQNVKKSGRGFTDVLFKQDTDLGVEFIYNTQATSLITDPDGRVVGVVTTKGNFRGDKGVILATAGFSRNQKIINAFAPDLVGSCAGAHNAGDGIIMGAAIGAQLVNMWCMQGPSVGTMSQSGICYDNLICTLGLASIDVGTDALRHYDEGKYYELKYGYVNDLPDHYIWNIWDQATTDLGPAVCFAPPCSENFDEEVAAGLIFREDTIEAIAADCGLDPDTLASTLDHYNEMATNGVDDDFGRTKNLTPLVTPPFYAAKGVPATPDTAGGLAFNSDAQVLNWSDEPIAGLYATGSTTGGWRGKYYPGCGTSIALACIYGRHAGIKASADEGGNYQGQLADDAGSYLSADSSSNSDIQLGANEYLGVGEGIGGDVKVKVTIEDGKITAVDIVEQNETEGVGSRAVEQLPDEIVAAQTYDVDAVSGATVSSDAIKAAVKDCMEQAGMI